MIVSPLMVKFLAGGIVAAALVGAGWKVGYERAEKKIGHEARGLVMAARDERDLCLAEVAKVNAATTEAALKKAAELEADKVRTDRARRALEAAAAGLANLQRETMALAEMAREYLENASDACASAPMPDDLNGVLDRLANPTRYGGSALPAGPADHRQGVSKPDAALPGQ